MKNRLACRRVLRTRIPETRSRSSRRQGGRSPGNPWQGCADPGCRPETTRIGKTKFRPGIGSVLAGKQRVFRQAHCQHCPDGRTVHQTLLGRTKKQRSCPLARRTHGLLQRRNPPRPRYGESGMTRSRISALRRPVSPSAGSFNSRDVGIAAAARRAPRLMRTLPMRP